MADLAESDVTVAVVFQDRNRRRRINDITIHFGNGALTYPANGVPLPADLRKFGLYRQIDKLLIQQPASGGILYVYDPTNRTIRMYRAAGFTPAGAVAAPVFTGTGLDAHTHDVKLIGGITADEPVAVEVATTKLGKNAATDRTIAGADSATKGGVVGVTGGTPAGSCSAPAFTGTAVAAAALAEFSGAVAEVTLEVLVKGV